ncbi:hypothetical protein BX616_010924 [Lobosporangium transversale]|uniref:Uncharacterized protein n=1 Tax=Lobosporangium transversale TaxID=64571 RepID=A0A1Y2GMI1_9FUNG|nr:hypothetical protein BCR41DRAFT_396512 [Lobosporangium transversale]KAF9910219.1 hypothetical protein BX616_010924 [Lobosporangium transversale]ORZ15549.1 hypothetical protein BCR41DRAFT_396512 [Lobosporangium transversale]|eukprot:XP_021881297.1 hypothetical protein BCR41DRAFT_396512 [Lobosporangium transversale]
MAGNNIIGKVYVRTASASVSNGNSSYNVNPRDIRHMFPDAMRFKLDGHPGRHYRSTQLSNSNVAISMSCLRESVNPASQDLPLVSSNTTTPSFNSSLTTPNNGQTEMINTSLGKGIELLLEVKD